MPKKLDYVDVKKTIESLGAFKLITPTYEGSSHLLEILCLTCNYTSNKTLPDFKKNQCAPCGRARGNAKKRTPIDEVKAYIKLHGNGDEMSSTTYVNKDTPIQVHCAKCFKDYPITFVNFKEHNGRCPCKYKRTYHTYQSVAEYIEKRGDSLISKTYSSIHDPLQISCGKCKTNFPMTFHYYYDKGLRCPCYKD